MKSLRSDYFIQTNKPKVNPSSEFWILTSDF